MESTTKYKSNNKKYSTYERNKNDWAYRGTSLTRKTNKQKNSEKHKRRKLETHAEGQGFPGGSDSKESAMRETWVWSLGQEDPLKKGMATHSSILAWRIPWTEEPGRAIIHGVIKSWTQLSNYTFL